MGDRALLVRGRTVPMMIHLDYRRERTPLTPDDLRWFGVMMLVFGLSLGMFRLFA